MEKIYTSTRNKALVRTPKEAVVKGIAEDGGLFVYDALDTLRQVGGIAAPGEVCDEGVCHDRSPPVVWMVSSLHGFGGAVQLGSKSDK